MVTRDSCGYARSRLCPVFGRLLRTRVCDVSFGQSVVACGCGYMVASWGLRLVVLWVLVTCVAAHLVSRVCARGASPRL